RNFFQSASQTRIPKNILAQFGYALSGPIYLPRFGEGGKSVWSGKNKLFFFTDLERTTQRNTAGTTRTIAPTSLRPDANGNVSFAGTGAKSSTQRRTRTRVCALPFQAILFPQVGLISLP